MLIPFIVPEAGIVFEINGVAAPAGCEPRSPLDGSSYEKLILPDSTGLSGDGYPVGAVGYPVYEIFYDFLSTAGWAYFVNLIGEATYVPLTSLQLWSPYANSGAGAYVTYTHAHMHRPKYDRMIQGGTGYENVLIRFTELS